ncbi:hypothetical protein KKE26_07750 [bacterium]|nr:hypothetical protein [bacterium]MBU1753427.1 hypothetical protein [bacterium]
MIRKIWIIMIVVFLSSRAFGGGLKYAELVEPQTLNPLNMVDTVSFRFSNLLYNGLMWTDQEMLPEPELLKLKEPVSISDDGKTYVFQLKDNVVWSDGQPFTAKDVEFTFKMIADSRTDTNLGWIRDVFADVTAIDTHTVKFTLQRKINKDDLLGMLFFKVIPYHCFPENKEYISVNDNFGRAVVQGTGPYTFNKWIPNKGIRLVRNKGYFKPFRKLNEDQGQTRIDEIIMKYIRDPLVQVESLLNPEGIQLIPVINPVYYNRIRANEDCSLIRYNSRRFAFFAYNCTNEFFKDPRVRLALTYAVNREAMIENVFGADMDKTQIMSGPYPPGEGDPNLEPIPYDPEKAVKLLNEAGFFDKNGDGILEKNGKDFEITLKSYAKDEDMRRVCTMYQADLLKIGVKLRNGKINFMEMNKWMKEVLKNRIFDVTFGTWIFHEDTDIVDDLFSSASARTDGNNFVSYVDPQVEKLLSLNRFTIDGEVRRANKQEIHRIIRQECPYTFLFTLPAYAGVRSSTLKGVIIHPCYFFAYITDWYLREL